jgi:hypothetical protein
MSVLIGAVLVQSAEAAFLLATEEHPSDPVFKFNIYDTDHPSVPVMNLSGDVPDELESITHAYDNVYYGMVDINGQNHSPVYRFVIDTYNQDFSMTSYAPNEFMGEADSAAYVDKGGVKQLYSIDKISGELRSVVFSGDEMSIVSTPSYSGDLGLAKVEAMTYDAVNHKLYFLETVPGSDSKLYSIDGIAGTSDMDASTLTYIGSVGYEDVEGLSFGSDGRLYAASEYDDVMFEIDPFTGAGTSLGSISGADIEGLAKFTANIPEPSSLIAFLAVVCTGMIITRRRD